MTRYPCSNHTKPKHRRDRVPMSGPSASIRCLRLAQMVRSRPSYNSQGWLAPQTRHRHRSDASMAGTFIRAGAIKRP